MVEAIKNKECYPELEEDLKRFRRMHVTKYLWTLAGAAFALMVFNPNYTLRRSYYVRKMTPFFFGGIGYEWGHMRAGTQTTNIMIKQYDFMPHDVQMTVKTKDYRYMALAQLEEAQKTQKM